MSNSKIALMRFPAFMIDFTLIMIPFVIFEKTGLSAHLFVESIDVEWIMFCYIPCLFFIYWALNINIGKRIFRLEVVDADTGDKATVFQLFKRALLFSLIVSINVAFIIPLFATKKNQSFHDMMANTVVIKRKK